MISEDESNRGTVDNASWKNKEVAKVKHPSRHPSTGYPSTKTTSSKTHVSKRSSNSSTSSSNTRHTQTNHRANDHHTQALWGIGTQFRHGTRAKTIRDEIKFGPSTNTNSSAPHNPPLQQQEQSHTTRLRASQPKYSRTFNDTMGTYLQSQENPSQQYALYCRRDTGQLSTQRQR